MRRSTDRIQLDKSDEVRGKNGNEVERWSGSGREEKSIVEQNAEEFLSSD